VQGIEELYTHQAQALDAARNGESILVTTRTASGKSLCYNLPVLEQVLADGDARALYLFPSKALAQDQLDRLRAFDLAPAVDLYDGDTPAAARPRVRDRARIVLSNPDMLHVGILPQHLRWGAFFRRLRYVVLDDLHVNRGVFGSHVANVLRRLSRMCRFHGSDPRFLCTSATLPDAGAFATTLIGEPARVIDDDGAPQGPRRFVLWNPPLRGGRGEAPRRSAYRDAAWLLRRVVEAEVKTIAFTKARKITELVHRYAIAALPPGFAERVSPYRAGYLVEDRRRIERRLLTGELLAVVSTSALELGIDVGGLDAAILVGYPGTVASTWQRAGRAGRAGQSAVVALDDALDQFLMRHPSYLFDRPVEAAVIDPGNPHVLSAHASCTAAELPLTGAEDGLFGPTWRGVVDQLTASGAIVAQGARRRWRGRPYPAKAVSIRSAGGAKFRIVDKERQRLLGTVEEARAYEEVHPGAGYLHQGDAFEVRRLDVADRTAWVRRAGADGYMETRSLTDVTSGHVAIEGALGTTMARLGPVDVTTQVLEYARKQLFSEQVLGVEPLDLPRQTLRTTPVWLEIPPVAADRLRDRGQDLAGAIHAAEHAAIGLLPLYAMCDRWDLGGVSYPIHPKTATPTIFVYDGYPGGAGFARRGYGVLETWLAATLDAIAACSYADGCPSCVQSPKCGNCNQPLDKAGAIALLRMILGHDAFAIALDARRTGRPDGGRGGVRR